MDEEKLREIRTGGQQVFDGRLLKVFRDEITLPNGHAGVREYIRHNGAVAIVAMDDSGRIIMERQFRYPVDGVISEIPAGKVDGPEDRLLAAKRELMEETGYEADNWESLGDYYPSAAYTSERLTLYLATGLHRGEQKLDEDEFLNWQFVPLDEVVEEIMAGGIPDGKTQAAVLKAALLLGK